MDTELLEQIAKMLDDQAKRIELKIETDIAKRIDALFDGYKLTHEKQWELERETEALKETVSDLQARLTALENKIA